MSFDSLYGHAKQVQILRSAMERNRVAHAYLFYGPEGTGKLTLSEIFAAALNCRKAKGDACGTCPSCRKANRSTHPDVIAVKPQGAFIRIVEIRNLQEKMSFRPLEGERRVFIIDDADRMNVAAANALLKTLEEPSPLNVLILVTSRPRRLPATILSRCQRIRFSPLPVAVVSQYLQDKCGLDPDMARILATCSGGSISLALKMNQQTYLETRDEVLNSLSSFFKEGLIGLLTMDFGKDREDAAQRLEILRTCFRDALILRETGNVDLVIYRDRMDTASMLAEKLSPSMLLRGVWVVEDAIKALEQNANKQLTLEAMMFKLAPK